MNDTLVYKLFAAFAGGVILNVMPCVLPVLTMKVFHVIEQAGQTPRKTRIHGLAYTGGILFAFIAFATVVIVLRASGERMGWGMQFQSAGFVAVMTALIFAFGLNALGVFEINISMRGASGSEGYSSSFVNGILASIMSTPCSAPYLGTAASFALGANAVWWHTLVMFVFIGLGLAFPFLLISYVPALARVLPRPGAWMETFKKLMGFTLMLAVIWLFSVLQRQIGGENASWFLVFLLALAIALWGVDHWGGLLHSLTRRLTVRAVAVGAVVLAGMTLVDLSKPPPPKVIVKKIYVRTPAGAGEGGAAGDEQAATLQAANAAAVLDEPVVVDNEINWAPFDAQKVASESARARPVFMDYTADWCLNCKTNEKAFIETDKIRAVLSETNILPMKADMTEENDEIEAWLEKLGRSGIPAYVIYMPDGSFDLLPEAITTEMLATRLQAAAKKYPPTGFKGPKAAGSS